jgi:hypothetical protein
MQYSSSFVYTQAMSLLWPSEIGIAIGLGLASHLLIFIRGELDRYAAVIVLFFAISFILLVLLSTIQESSFLTGFLLATVLFSTYQIALAASILVYRLWFHRACQFPGPIRSAASKWEATKKAKEAGQYHLELARQHAKYGDIVRTGGIQPSLFDCYRRAH